MADDSLATGLAISVIIGMETWQTEKRVYTRTCFEGKVKGEDVSDAL